MKRESIVVIFGVFLIMAALLGSCHTTKYRTIKPEEAGSNEKIGHEVIEFTADYNGFWISKAVKEAAHIKLLEKAKADFPSHVVEIIDINITMPRAVKKKDGPSTYLAAGTVVLSHEAGTRQGELIVASKNLEEVIPVIVDKMIAASLPKKSIAIVSIIAQDPSLADLTGTVMDFLTEKLQGSGYEIVDRANLAAIRSEKALQASGDISDDSAVSIGQELGAAIVITGTLSGIGHNRKIRISALDVMTAKTLFTGNEKF